MTQQNPRPLEEYFPIPAAYFGMVLGIIGMGAAWRFAARQWGLPVAVGESLMALGSAVWLALACVFIYKWLFCRAAALAEVRDPVQCCFISLFPGAMMLVGVAAAPYSRTLALGLVLLGTLGQLAFAAYRSAGLWRGRHSPEATTPGIYLPTVASNLISAIALGSLGYGEWGYLFLGAGIFSWLSLEPVILARLRTLGELPKPARPTIGIQLAPPLVACTAYLSVNGGVGDIFAQVLFGYGLLQVIFLARLLVWTFEQPFSPSFWSFSFGVSALAGAALRFLAHKPDSAIAMLAWPIFIFSNIVIALLILGTLLRIAQGKFFLLRPAAAGLKTD